VEKTGDTEPNEFKDKFFLCSIGKLRWHVGREPSRKLVLVEKIKMMPSSLDWKPGENLWKLKWVLLQLISLSNLMRHFG
jgi:hypothetical protein